MRGLDARTSSRTSNARHSARSSAARATKKKRNFNLPYTNSLASNPYTSKAKPTNSANAPGPLTGVTFASKTPLSTTGSRMLVPLSSNRSRGQPPAPLRTTTVSSSNGRRTSAVNTSSGRIRPGKSIQMSSTPSLGHMSRNLQKGNRSGAALSVATSTMPAISAASTTSAGPLHGSGTASASTPDGSKSARSSRSASLELSTSMPTGSKAVEETMSTNGLDMTISLAPGGSPRGLTGLMNLGNTCFMNSCLQCLSNVPPLLSYLFDKQMALQINVRSQSKGELAKNLAALFKRMWTAKPYSAENPRAVKQLIGRVASRFSGYSQQDAQEFLRFLLDGLHADLNLVVEPPPYKELDISESLPEMEKSAIWWENYCQRNNSTVKNLFCGQLRSQVTCCTCSKRSTAFDPFWDLSIPIPKEFQSFARSRAWRLNSISGSNSLFGKSSPPGKSASKTCSVMDCLSAFTEEEILEGNDAYYCSRCKSHQKSTKSMCVFRLPRVLVIHLKRFSFGLNRRTKLTTEIRIPLKGLDISGICATPGNKQLPLYDLVAVSNHMGGCFGGHYTADCLNQTTKKWYRFNDSDVSEISENRLDAAAAYLLFYLQRPSIATPTRHSNHAIGPASETTSAPKTKTKTDKINQGLFSKI